MLATVHTRPRSVVTSDAEEHTRFRRMLSKPFTFKRVEALRPAVQKITDEHIDALLGGSKPGDIVGTVALPVPSLVISRLLGVPYGDAEFFQAQAARGMGRYATAQDTNEGAASLAKYIANLVRTKMHDLSEDLVSDLAERVNAEEFSVREAAQLATGVLIAGHETTANMLSLSIAALRDHPDQLALMRDTDDPKVIAGTVEELMRYLSIIQTGQRRIAVEDIEIGGETIRAGEGIILDVAPANWDARQFPDPDRLDLARDDGPHVGFGYGRHQCVGQQLARMELHIVLPTLLRRIPTLRLASTTVRGDSTKPRAAESHSPQSRAWRATSRKRRGCGGSPRKAPASRIRTDGRKWCTCTVQPPGCPADPGPAEGVGAQGGPAADAPRQRRRQRRRRQHQKFPGYLT